MNFLANQRKRKLFIVLTSIAAISAAVVIFCALYLGDYYRANNEAISTFESNNINITNSISRQTLDDNTIVFTPENATTALIFYPGGKVEYTAYAPLMAACASEGIMCILVEMPFNLAVFDINAADGIQEMYPDIENWYIGGHSLGGSMAASYLSDTPDDFEGLILLGSYSTENLSDTSVDVLSVYGSEDKVLNREKYDKNKTNLPAAFTEVVIDGGCHAYFGMYGAQDGDGTPTISNEDQIKYTVDTITKFINK